MRAYSDETKAAVMAALLAGQSVSQVAREYTIPRGTLASWRSRQFSGGNIEDDIAREVTKIVANSVSQYLREYGLGDAVDKAKKAAWKNVGGSLSSPTYRGARVFPRGSSQVDKKYLYLVKEAFRGLVKIGITANLYARFAAMQTGCPQDLRLIAYAELQDAELHEATLHNRFAEKHHRGEWFELDEDDIDLIMRYHSAFVAADYAWGDTPMEGYAKEAVRKTTPEQIRMFEDES